MTGETDRALGVSRSGAETTAVTDEFSSTVVPAPGAAERSGFRLTVLALLIWLLASDLIFIFTELDRQLFLSIDFAADIALIAAIMIQGWRSQEWPRLSGGARQAPPAARQESAGLLLRAVMESSPDINLFALDRNYCYATYNKVHERHMAGLCGHGIWPGMNYMQLLTDPEERRRVKALFDRTLSGESFSVTEENEERNTYWKYYYSPVTASDGAVTGITCLALDISGMKLVEMKNSYLSYHDQLTGLYNRRYYEDRVVQMDREEYYPLSLIVADVNGLKFANDVFGHMVGDQLIREFAEVLSMRCRRQDVVARFGGDEFVILLPNTDAQELEAVLNSVQSTMDNCKPDRGILSVSFGWATKYSTEEKYDQIFRKADDMMYNHKLVSKVQFDSSMMNHLGAILSEHSPKWRGHAQRVSRLCKQMGLCLGMEGRELSKLEMAGYLHDIGMAALDKEILDKTDDLSRYELQEIQRHCELGYKILSHVNGYRDVAEWVLHHHERPDGDGYPFGLKGQDIPQCSSIINIANAYDAISEGSVYGKKRPREEAIAELLSKAGTQFDERLTHIFVNQALDKEQEA